MGARCGTRRKTGEHLDQHRLAAVIRQGKRSAGARLRADRWPRPPALAWAGHLTRHERVQGYSDRAVQRESIKREKICFTGANNRRPAANQRPRTRARPGRAKNKRASLLARASDADRQAPASPPTSRRAHQSAPASADPFRATRAVRRPRHRAEQNAYQATTDCVRGAHTLRELAERNPGGAACAK